MPDFSVIIPCYRQAHLLAAAIESASQQAQGVSVEVIVVDDGSPDDVAKVAGCYPDVTLIRQPNAGLCAARNRGILRSTGRYLLFLDADDYLRPGMLAAAARAFTEDGAAAVVHGLADVVDESGERVIAEFGGTDLSDTPFQTLLRQNVAPPNTFVVRREALALVGLFDVALRSCEDWDLWLRIAAAGGRFRLVRDMRSAYRITPGSMSKNLEVMWQAGSAVLRKNGQLQQGCRAAMRVGLSEFSLSMRPLLRNMLRTPGGVRRAAGVLLRNPQLLAWQLYWVLRRGVGFGIR